jgi:hypothetical protein
MVTIFSTLRHKVLIFFWLLFNVKVFILQLSGLFLNFATMQLSFPHFRVRSQGIKQLLLRGVLAAERTHHRFVCSLAGNKVVHVHSGMLASAAQYAPNELVIQFVVPQQAVERHVVSAALQVQAVANTLRMACHNL